VSGRTRPSPRLSADAGNLVFIGLLPPPIDGQRLATERMQALLQTRFRLAVYDIGPRPPLTISSRLWRTARAMLGLLGWRWRRVRAVYLVPYTGHALWLAALLVGWARLLGFRLTVHLHSGLFFATRRPAMRIFSAAAGQRALYLCLGPRMAAALTRLYPAARQTLSLSNAIFLDPPPTPRQRRPLREGHLRLGHLSNLGYAKGLDTVLATARALTAAELPFVLDLAGPVEEPWALPLQTAVAADPERLRYRGPLFGRDKDDWFDSIDVFLLPTRHPHEASPLVLFEAMRAGAVPVATDRGLIADDLGAVGLVTDPAPEAFVAAVVDLVRDCQAKPQRLQALSSAAAARFDALRAAAVCALADAVERMAPSPGASSGGTPRR
jgi:glycosyltransferase involved in cell wall biosynthesis